MLDKGLLRGDIVVWLWSPKVESKRPACQLKIQEILKSKRTLSYEFYPPKDAEGVSSLLKTIGLLKAFRPDYISVTYGAGGSTRMLTEDVVVRAKREAGLLSMAHLTCVGQTKEEIHGVLKRLESAGIENVIALRGEPPRGPRRRGEQGTMPRRRCRCSHLAWPLPSTRRRAVS